MKKSIHTLALGLCLVAITACSSARGESAGSTDLDVNTAAAEECAGMDAAECATKTDECCAEAEVAKAKEGCCAEDADS